jgi:uncharacterized protein YbaA (DUF1428 family)
MTPLPIIIEDEAGVLRTVECEPDDCGGVTLFDRTDEDDRPGECVLLSWPVEKAELVAQALLAAAREAGR